MNRREFCCRAARAGGLAMLAPLREACGRSERVAGPGPRVLTSSASPASILAHASPDETARIALVKTADRADGVRRAIDLLGINPVHGSRVLLKPNFNSADEAPGSTHPDILRSLIVKLNDMGAPAVTVADRSGMGNTRAVMQQLGVFDLAGELGFSTVMLDELDDKDWILRVSDNFHWARGYAVPRMLLEAECVVQTCNLKTHRFGGHFTLSIKNAVGFAAKRIAGTAYDYMNEMHASPYQRHMIAELNAAYAPALIVLDGVEAFVDGGPDQGKRVRPEVVLAGTDRIAIDAVGVAILRMFGTTRDVSRGPIFDQVQIARAVELVLGIDSPEKITLVTDDAESVAFATRIADVLSRG